MSSLIQASLTPSRSLGLGRGLHTQHVPSNVWAKFFAAHLAIGRALDGGAASSRNTADAAGPLPDQLRLTPYSESERCLAPRSVIDVFPKVHADHLKRRASHSQAVRLLPKLSETLAIKGMETVGEVRRQNLEILVDQYGTLAAVAELPEPPTTSVYLSQVRKQAEDRKTKRPREMGGRLARRIEAGAGKPSGWMDTPHPELVVIGTTPEKPSIATSHDGVKEVTQAAAVNPAGEREISPQSEPKGIPIDMSTRLHSTVLQLGNLLGALDDTSRKIMAVLLKRLTEDPDGAAEYADRAVANVKIQRRLVADVELDKKLTALSEVTTQEDRAPG